MGLIAVQLRLAQRALGIAEQQRRHHDCSASARIAVLPIRTGLLPTPIRESSCRCSNSLNGPNVRGVLLRCHFDKPPAGALRPCGQASHHREQKRAPTHAEHQFGIHLFTRLYSERAIRHKTIEGKRKTQVMVVRARNKMVSSRLYHFLDCTFFRHQIKTLRLATSYITYLTRVLEGDQDPSSGFRAELVPSSRKINAERRAKCEAQVREKLIKTRLLFACITFIPSHLHIEHWLLKETI